MQPEGGEINYGLAQKNPEKFYKHVMSQNLTKKQARDTADGKTKVTTTLVRRKMSRILMLVLTKFVESFRGKYN